MCQSSTRGMQGDAGIFFTRRWQRGDASSALGCSSSTPKRAARTSPMCWAFDRQRAQNTPRGSAGTPLTLLPLRIFPFFVFVLISLPVRDGAPWKVGSPDGGGDIGSHKGSSGGSGGSPGSQKGSPTPGMQPSDQNPSGLQGRSAPGIELGTHRGENFNFHQLTALSFC